MTRSDPAVQADLFDRARESIGQGDGLELEPGAVVLRGYAVEEARALLGAIAQVAQAAPLRHMATARGWRMSVAMTNCGDAGWLSDRSGYRYDAVDPQTGRPWPAMPEAFANIAVRAARAAGFEHFEPDACLINRYAPGARLSLHQDRNEQDFDAPIVSVSLGVPASFLWGGATRANRPRRVRLEHGDIVVWGGPARLNFHGIDTLREGHHALTGCVRFNLTFRRALSRR
ncbi:MAG: DNA oxidative demethylase AlkB [Burkholderiales bacterium]